MACEALGDGVRESAHASSSQKGPLMTRRGQTTLFCQTRNRGGRLIYDPEQDIYQCPGRGKDCRFAESADGTLERFGADCGRLPQASRGK
jgi:hypothetical protein